MTHPSVNSIVERLLADSRPEQIPNLGLLPSIANLMREAATIISDLQAERDALSADLEKVQTELDEENIRALTAESSLSRIREETMEARNDLRAMWSAIDANEIRICELCGAWMTIEEHASVEDVSICPREAFGSVRFPNEPCFKHRAWLYKEEQAAIRSLGSTGGAEKTAESGNPAPTRERE